jgi:initiation factor 1A
MVKNIKGGKNAKKGARFQSATYFRTPQEGEMVVMIDKNLGNGILQVKGYDGTLYQCHIRKKFTKERFSLRLGVWVLVGLREFETQKKVCDLLEVYSDSDVQRLLTMDGTWLLFQPKEDIFHEEIEVISAPIELDTEINIDDI